MQVDGISLQHQHHLAENAALAECQALIQEAAKGWQATAKAAEQVSQSALQRAGQEYMHAATRHLYYQRALLQLLLRQLTFCAGELKGAMLCHHLLLQMHVQFQYRSCHCVKLCPEVALAKSKHMRAVQQLALYFAIAACTLQTQ